MHCRIHTYTKVANIHTVEVCMHGRTLLTVHMYVTRWGIEQSGVQYVPCCRVALRQELNHLKTGMYVVAVLEVSKELCMCICTSHTVHTEQQGPATQHNIAQQTPCSCAPEHTLKCKKHHLVAWKILKVNCSPEYTTTVHM